MEKTFTKTILKYDILNKNDRIYTKDVVLKMIEDFNMTEEPLIGELCGDEVDLTEIIDLSKVSHELKDLYLNEDTNELIGEFNILPTPQGKLLEMMNEKDIVVEPRGYGHINDKKEVWGYELISFNVVNK
tara:strand:+ start:184279 stop:184668 length:390 start_codon:yes stop_codon:yes gene_type:complete